MSNVYEKLSGDIGTTTNPEYKTRKGETMKAVAWFGDKDVRVIDTPAPAVTEPQDAIVGVTGTTVCGSDLHLYHKEFLR